MKESASFAESQPFGSLENQITFSASGNPPNSANSAKTNFKNGLVKHGSHRKASRANGSAFRNQKGAENRRGHLYKISDPAVAQSYSGRPDSTLVTRSGSVTSAKTNTLRVKRSAGVPASKYPRVHRPQQREGTSCETRDSVDNGERKRRAHWEHITNIDAPHRGSVQLVPAYAQANALHLREEELRCRPGPDYLQSVQRTVTGDMRAVLVDWLVEVAEEYKLVTETLFLTVAYLDLFLSARHIEPPQLQLLGVTSMCIASKFEEIFPPPIEKYSEITDRGCTIHDIAGAEIQVLRVLDFQLAVPTSKVFLQRFLRAAQVATASEYRYLEHLARYVLELSLLDHTLLAFRTSTIAAAALFLSRVLLAKAHARTEHMRSHVVWTRTMEHYTFHSAAELRLCVRQLHCLLLDASNARSRMTAIRTKYRSQRRMAVASMYFVPSFPDDVFEQYHGIAVPAEMLNHEPQ